MPQTETLATITQKRRIKSPTITPQALAYDGGKFWLSSRDLGTFNKVDPANWKVIDELDPPGIVWAAVVLGNGEMRLTIGKGLNDDRYIYRYASREGFTKMFACPDLTGSYLGWDGTHLYMSQWYEEHILQFDDKGNVLRTIEVGAEICGFTFVDDAIYVLRGKENKNVPGKSEEWRIARFDPANETPNVEDLAIVPFESRSLAFDGEFFWSNHRAANEIVCFNLP